MCAVHDAKPALVNKPAGTVRFVTPDGNIDAVEGNLMCVPPRAVHTFENPSDTEEAECFMTATPGMSSLRAYRVQ